MFNFDILTARLVLSIIVGILLLFSTYIFFAVNKADFFGYWLISFLFYFITIFLTFMTAFNLKIVMKLMFITQVTADIFLVISIRSYVKKEISRILIRIIPLVIIIGSISYSEIFSFSIRSDIYRVFQLILYLLVTKDIYMISRVSTSPVPKVILWIFIYTLAIMLGKAIVHNLSTSSSIIEGLYTTGIIFFMDLTVRLLYIITMILMVIERVVLKAERTASEEFSKQKITSISRLVAGLMHNLSTPIGNIRTTSSFLLETFNEEKNTHTEAVALIDNNAKIIADQVNNLKGVIGVDDDIKHEFLIKEFIFQSCYIFNTQDNTDRLSITADIEEMYISVNKTVLFLILNTLLENIQKHAYDSDNMPVIIRGRSNLKDNSYSIEVSDKGKGLDDNAIKQVMEPYWRASGYSLKNGLGLFICYQYITINIKGKMDVKSKKGEGTTIEFTIPINED